MRIAIRSATLLICSVCVGALSAADHVKLTSGLDIEGQVICDSPATNPLVAIAIDGKVLAFNRSEIASTSKDDEGRAEYTKRRDAIKGKNAAAHFELYTWAKSQHFFDYANQELSLTLQCDPSHAEARKIVYAPTKLSKPSANAEAIAQTPAADESMVIGVRPGVRQRSAIDERLVGYCKILMEASPADEVARKNALAVLTIDRAKNTDALVALLDPARDTDEQTRLAALAGIDALKSTGASVSNRLAQTAISDRFLPVRSRSVALIKSRNDESAMNSMVNAYVSSFDESGSVRDPILKGAAVVALKGLEDKRVMGALFYRATLEVRTAVADLNALTTRQIDSYTVNNGAQATVIVPLSFPIQFPDLNLTSVKTTVCSPCSALTDFTGQRFGNDLDAWAKFIRMQK
jgi:hypothetical protein